MSRAVNPLARARGHLWAHSPEPLRQPLLRRTHATAELRDAACQIFIDILPRHRPAARAPQGPGHTGRGGLQPRGAGSGRVPTSQPILPDSHTHPQVHGRLPVQAGLGLTGAHRPDLRGGPPGGRSAGRGLLSDPEAADAQYQEVCGRAMPGPPSSPPPKGCAGCSEGEGAAHGGHTPCQALQAATAGLAPWSVLQTSWGGHSKGPRPCPMPPWASNPQHTPPQNGHSSTSASAWV